MSEDIIVKVDEDFKDLVPGFLSGRVSDIDTIRSAVAAPDFEVIRILGHTMKGTGGSYGFDAITDIGASIETAAKAGDATAIERHVVELSDYLSRVKVEYVPED